MEHPRGQAGPDRPLIAIAAVARNGVIGAGGRMPWHLPEDFRRFKKVTMGGSLIMGRKTFESIGSPLPGRTSIVVSRRPPGPNRTEECLSAGTRVIWVSSVAEALAVADWHRPVFVAGGAEIFRQAWPLLTDLDITEVDQEPAGDTFFPEIDPEQWQEVSREPHPGFDFVRYRRRAE